MGDFLGNILSLNAFTPRYMMQTALQLMLQSADLLKNAIPENAGGLEWQELHNKLQAFYLFEHVDSILGLSPGSHLTLEQTIERTRSLGPFFSVWATEGLGHYYPYLRAPDLRHPAGALPSNLLSESTLRLPRESLVALHAGMGLALAEALLARGHDSETLAGRLLHLCRNNSLPLYWPVAFEALGLVVRNLRPGMIAALDQRFSREGEELLAYFWHGVGRGIYFAPVNALPYWSRPWQGFDTCLQAPHELGRRNAVAGFAWAMILVNLHQPEIVASFLKRYGAKVAANDAFGNGVFSALSVWLHSAPRDPSARAFGSYAPASEDAFLLRLWKAHVQQPYSQAFHYHSANRALAISEVFRYHALLEFASQCKFAP